MKVLIADEHALFRDGLGLLIEQLDGSATILQASNFAQALKILDTEHNNAYHSVPPPVRTGDSDISS